MANFTTSTPTTSDPSEIHGLLAVGTDNTGKLLDPDALANLAYTASPTQGTVTSDTGTDATIPAADGTNAGLFLPAEKTKLAGIAEGAEVNVNADWNAVSGDAQILNKPTIVTDHTGLSSIGTNTHAQIDSHLASTANPHSVTKTQVGLGNVANADTTTTANITDSSNKRFITDAQQTVLSNTSGVNTGDQNLFQTIAVSGQNNVVADSTADTLTLAAGSNITITTDALTDTITIASGVANLAYTASPTQGTVTSDTGTDAIIPAADGTNAGLFLPAEKTKLAGIAEGAEVNVNADWNASSGDAQILNKPTLGTAAATNSTDYATAAQGAKADTAVQPAAIGSTVLAFDSNLQSFVNAFTLPTTDGTAGQSLVTNGAGVISFATPAILADPVYIGGVAYFNRSTKPTERSAGLPLVIGDRWYKTDDGTEWFWNGTYWLGLSPIIRSGYGSRGTSGNFTATNSIIMSPRRGSAYMLFLESADYLVKVTTADSLNYWDVKWRNTAFSGLIFPGSFFPGDPGFTVNSPTDTYNKQSLNVLISGSIPIVAVGPLVIKTGIPSDISMSYNMILREVFP